MEKKLQEIAPIIFETIQKSERILLHCHPSPDPDSVGSVLGMKFALESMGKKVTAIKGDSDIPEAFMHFPGAQEIVKKSFSEINLKDFDLFIILDSGSVEMISGKEIPKFPLPIATIVIDHHASNSSYGEINFIDLSSPATAFTLYKLFKEWNIALSKEIAINLFMGIYTDTGAFRFPRTDHKVFEGAAELVKIAPDYSSYIFEMENSRRKESIVYQALAFNSLETFFEDKFALTSVSYEEITKNNLTPEDYSVAIPNFLLPVKEFVVTGSLVEIEPGRVKLSMRSKDPKKYDISKRALALGGGGHTGAAGARINFDIHHAKEKVVETAKLLYNL